jgi:RNA polymerase sigma-70 factor (ECF subfamily)
MSEKPPADIRFDELVAAAKSGSNEEIGRLLDSCRTYLLSIANQEMTSRGQPKVTASDVVQETFLEAHRDFASFAGSSVEKLRGWLRQMLLHNIEDSYRRYVGSAKRQASREADLTASANWRTLNQAVGRDPTPSRVVRDRERDAQLEQAIAMLPDDYRAVILMRYREDASFEDIAARMNRSVDAVRKLWLRGVKRLQEILVSGQEHEPL